MIIYIPPNSFEWILNRRECAIIRFTDPYNDDHSNIQELMYHNSVNFDHLTFLKIRLYSYPYVKYFNYVTDPRTVLYLRNNQIVGMFIVKNESDIQTVFKFFDINIKESIFYLI